MVVRKEKQRQKGELTVNEATAPDLVLGTAGHIDHGKSSLILALTGVNPDRLAEERKRGITIELGFAQLKLPDGRNMGVVDVPGHEKFVRQMIAGSTGIDVALLVIAADDGVMPQTLEHIAVLQTLGVRACVVALTKIDMVDEEWLILMEEEVRNVLSATPYADAPIVPVSNKTGEGLDDIRWAIAHACEGTQSLHRCAGIRQPIDRVFTIKGAGTVITGTLWSGVARPDEPIEILPSGKRCRIRTVQMHDRRVDEAPAGNRVALNLSDVKTSDISPGDFIASPGMIEATDRFDAHFTYLDTAKTGKPLMSGARMHVAHGTKEVLGRVLFADDCVQLSSGQSCFAQIRLEEPLPVSLNDRFIVRTYSPVHVAGGGQVLLAHPRHRTNLHGELLVLEALKEGRFKDAVATALDLQTQLISVHEIAMLFGVDEATMKSCLCDLQAEGKACVLGANGDYYLTIAGEKRALQKIDQALKSFHAKNPTELGMAKEELRQQTFPNMEALRFGSLLDDAVAKKTALIESGKVCHPSARGAALKQEENAAAKLSTYLKSNGVTPPELKEAAADLKIDLSLLRRAAARLEREGRAYRASSELYYDGETVEAVKTALKKHFEGAGEGTVGALGKVVGASRKYVVPLLEAFDKEGFTVRDGNERRLR